MELPERATTHSDASLAQHRKAAPMPHDNKAFQVTECELTGATAAAAATVPKDAEAGAATKATAAQRTVAPSAHGPAMGHPTTYMESLTHLLRGNIGSGLMAMGDAFKNGGLFLAPFLTLFLGIICVHCQHVLLKCSRTVKLRENRAVDPDFAETVELSFKHGPAPLRRCAPHAKFIVNLFLCVTQLSFCCVYFVFASSSFKQIADHYGYQMDLHVHMFIILLPVMLPALVPNLKYLAPFSTAANASMALGIVCVFYYMFRDLRVVDIQERHYVGTWASLPLFYGTAVYAFEGIGLVLPLKNSMIEPDQFDRRFGVLNVGIAIVTMLMVAFGFFGYWRWGDAVQGSLTLNLPEGEILSELVKFFVAFCIVLTFALQFFVPIQIMWPFLTDRFGPFRSPLFAELMFRTAMVCLTFAIAQLVPHLNVIISLIGALCSTALALFIPAIIELVLAYGTEKGGPSAWVIVKNGLVILLASVGLVTGTMESINELLAVIGT